MKQKNHFGNSITNKAKAYIIICIGIISTLSAYSTLYEPNLANLFSVNLKYYCGSKGGIFDGDRYNGILGVSLSYFAWFGIVMVMSGGYLLLFSKRE